MTILFDETKRAVGGRRAVFFDRDGVLNVDLGYVGTVERFVWIEGAKAAIARLNRLGFYVFVVTNQSGVARGYYTEDDVRALHNHMMRQLLDVSARIDAFRYCPFLPGAKIPAFDMDSPMRKPSPGMLLELIEQFDVSRAESFMVGDKLTDMQAAQAAGVAGKLFLGGNLDEFLVDCLKHQGISCEHTPTSYLGY